MTGELGTRPSGAAADDPKTSPRANAPHTCVGGMLLSGGASRRMGFDKATLEVRGVPLAVRVARLLRQVADDVVEVGPGVSGLRVVREDPPGQGPLAAIAAGWAALRDNGWHHPVLVMACDLPLLDLSLLEFLAARPGPDSVVPIVAGRRQPLCARWSVEDLDASAHAVRGGERSLRRLPAPDRAVLVDESTLSSAVDPATLCDVDSPADLDALGIPWRVRRAGASRLEETGPSADRVEVATEPLPRARAVDDGADRPSRERPPVERPPVRRGDLESPGG